MSIVYLWAFGLARLELAIIQYNSIPFDIFGYEMSGHLLLNAFNESLKTIKASLQRKLCYNFISAMHVSQDYLWMTCLSLSTDI